MNKLAFLFALVFYSIFSNVVQAQVSVSAGKPVMQWHFNGDRQKGTLLGSAYHGIDWVFHILPTDKKEYIGCGYTTAIFKPDPVGHPSDSSEKLCPVIFKLDNLGGLVWVKKVTGISGSGYTYPADMGGILFETVKTPNGYASGGYVFTRDLSGNDKGKQIAVVEFDEDGNLISPNTSIFNARYQTTVSIPNGSQSTYCAGRCLAVDPVTNDFIVAGESLVETRYLPPGATDSVSVPHTYLHVTKISYSSRIVLSSKTYGDISQGAQGVGTVDEFGGNGAFKILVDPNGTHDVFVCGYKSMPGDNTIVTDANADLTTTTLKKRNKDFWLLRLTNAIGVTPVYEKTYPKFGTGGLSSIYYTETGSASARNITWAVQPYIAGSRLAGKLAEAYDDINHPGVHNTDERLTDMVFTSDGNIAMVGYTNLLLTYSYFYGNNNDIIRNVGGVYDTRPGSTGYWYDEYTDGDGYLLKVNPSTGNKLWDKNIGHFSSKDFYLKMIQDNSGNYVIAGSSSDYYPSGSDLSTPDEYDALIVSTQDNSTPGHIWRRAIHAPDEDGMCVFAIAKTADNGFIIGGDNDDDRDNFSVAKFGPTCPKSTGYDLTGVVNIAGTTSWTGSKKIAAKVIVPFGQTLTINAADVQFASSDHIYDYWDINPTNSQIGIVVKPGGRLDIKNNAILHGLQNCGNLRNMWDGIVVQGNPGAPQNISNQGFCSPTQCVIEDARIGIMAADAYRTQTTGNYTLSPSGPYADFQGKTYGTRYTSTANMGGARILAKSTTFKNCRFAVNHQLYTYATPTGSFYDKCIFTTDAPMADICSYPGNDGRGEPTKTFFNDWRVSKINLTDNRFVCNATWLIPGVGLAYIPESLYPTGVVAAEASMSITRSCTTTTPGSCSSPFGVGNTFTRNKSAVEGHYPPGGNSYSLDVSYNNFEDNTQAVFCSSLFNSLLVHHNNLFIPQHCYGIILDGNKGYEVSNNSFSSCAACTPAVPGYAGIVANNGNFNDERIRQNNFEKIENASVSWGTNGYPTPVTTPQITGLQWKCNNYNAGTEYAIERVSYIDLFGSSQPPTLRRDQGNCLLPAPGYLSAPAGNTFNNACFANNRLWDDGNATQIVNYYNNQSGSSYDPGTCILTSVYNNTPCSSTPVAPLDACPVITYPASGGGLPTEIVASGNNEQEDPYLEKMQADLQQLDNAIAQTPVDDPNFAELNTSHHLLVSELSRYWAKADNHFEAGILLENYGRYDEAFPFYMQAQAWGDAERMIAAMPKNTQDEQDYTVMAQMSFDLYKQGKTWYDLGEENKLKLRDMVRVNSTSGYLAASVCEILGIPVAWPKPVFKRNENNGAMGRQQFTQPGTLGMNNVSAALGITLYPNPTNGIFTVHTNMAGNLYLYNIQGQMVGEYALNAGNTTLELGSRLSPGVYTGKIVYSSSITPVVVRLIYQP